MQENNSQIIIYQTENGETKLDVRFQDETVWLTQKNDGRVIFNDSSKHNHSSKKHI